MLSELVAVSCLRDGACSVKLGDDMGKAESCALPKPSLRICSKA